MGYAYFFQLCMRKYPASVLEAASRMWKEICPDTDAPLSRDVLDDLYSKIMDEVLEPFIIQLVNRVRGLATNWQEEGLAYEPHFATILGEKNYGPATLYSCGGEGTNDHFVPFWEKVLESFPGLSLSFYHCYYDKRMMTRYVFADGKLQDKFDSEAVTNIGGLEIKSSFSFRHTQFPQCISSFFSAESTSSYEYDVPAILKSFDPVYIA